jgi:hypothetical protein
VLAVRREGPRVCIEREGRAGCVPGFTPASAWTLVLPVPAFPPGLLFAFDLAWLAALALPIGFFGRANPRPWLAPLGAATALALPPAFGWLAPAPPGQWIAAALGWGLGRALARARDDASRG